MATARSRAVIALQLQMYISWSRVHVFNMLNVIKIFALESQLHMWIFSRANAFGGTIGNNIYGAGHERRYKRFGAA